MYAWVANKILDYLAVTTQQTAKVWPFTGLVLSTQGLVSLGKYDGTHPCLTAATSTDKVLIHSPHRRNSSVTGRVVWSESNREIATLNVNHTITALTTGILIPNDEKDVLVIGTSTHILVYHVHDNKDVFYKECQDGVKSVTIGTFKGNKSVVIVGGNSSVHGYNHLGDEMFWTAVGDIVTSVILMDYNKDGSNELLVASEDFKIRIFKGDQTIAEHTETEIVTNLVVLPESRFAYSVSNGTVGVYEQDIRLWRIKSKNFAIAMHPYDLLGQSEMQLIIGWSNGKIDCRSIKTGEVLFKDSTNAGAAGIVEGDYRSIGKTDIICVSCEGEAPRLWRHDLYIVHIPQWLSHDNLRIFGMVDKDEAKNRCHPTRQVRGFTTMKTLTNNVGESVADQDTVRELLTKKQTLLMELRQYENNTKYNENAINETESYENSGVIPSNTHLQIAINTNDASKKPHIEVYISTNNTAIIKALVIFAEGVFKGEAHVVHPSTPKLSSELSVPLFLPKDNPVDIHIKALVGYPNSIQFHVFEIARQLPCFAMYCLKGGNEHVAPDECVQFKVNERLQRICMWINQNFLFPSDVDPDSSPNLTLNLKCLRDDSRLVMTFEISGKVTFYTANMLLAANLVQSIATYLNIDSLESRASFPKDEENLKMLMKKLNDIQDARLRLYTDAADQLRRIRTSIIKAEDCRLNDLKEMPMYYNDLSIMNKELINAYNIKLQNHNEGVETMKKINAIVQKASKLRVGQKSSDMVNHCRSVIKTNNIEGLIKIIRTGRL